MTQAFDQAQRQIGALRAQSEALARLVMIAWANAGDHGNGRVDFSARPVLLGAAEVAGLDEYASIEPRELPQ